MHVYRQTAGSLHCTAETNVIVKQLNSNKKILKKKKKKTKRKMCQEPKRHFMKEKNVRNLILMKSKYIKVKPRVTLLKLSKRQSLKARPPNSQSEVYIYWTTILEQDLFIFIKRHQSTNKLWEIFRDGNTRPLLSAS